MRFREVNFDGIVGPTHNYAGLSYGNVASMTHKSEVSNPKQAALEGLAKMKFLMDMGVPQGVLPPHERPHLPTLRRLGFSGSDAQILDRASREAPLLLASVSSASAMWAANAATVSPSPDTADGRVHFTPANLVTQFHRSIEPPTTARILQAIFADEKHFAHHPPLPASPHFADEGAANHMRLGAAHAEQGVEVFVFGRRAFDSYDPAPARFPARQSFEASVALARQHLLDPAKVLFLQQNPRAIDAGAFHNDVVAVANAAVLLHHAEAYTEASAAELADVAYTGIPATMPIADAIKSYVFNSQFVTLPDSSRAIIAPVECREIASAREYLDTLIRTAAVSAVHYVDVRQSMHNGGGPACLRLRVVLSDEQITAMRGNVLLTPALHEQLKDWIERHYRDRLDPSDLRDPKLLEESRRALDDLTQLLQLGDIFEFQRS